MKKLFAVQLSVLLLPGCEVINTLPQATGTGILTANEAGQGALILRQGQQLF